MEENKVDNCVRNECENEEEVQKDGCDISVMCEGSVNTRTEDIEKLENWDMEFLKEDEEEVLVSLSLCSKKSEGMDKEEVKDGAKKIEKNPEEGNKENKGTRRNIGERKRTRDASSEEDELRKKEKKEMESENSEEKDEPKKEEEERMSEENLEIMGIGNSKDNQTQLVKLETVATPEGKCDEGETLEKDAEIVHFDGVGERERTDSENCEEFFEDQQREVEKDSEGEISGKGRWEKHVA